MAKILIIDSDAQTRRGLSHLFMSQGFQAGAVTNGVEAARLMRHEQPDLILIDQEVPLGGLKTAQIIRLNPRYQNIPILLGMKSGTPNQTRDILRQAIKNGISWALARPYEQKRLIEKTRESLNPGGEVQKQLKSLPPEVLGVRIRQRLREIADLPTLSVAQQHLIELMSQDDSDVNMNDVIQAIQSDQALSMRTLRIARSAGYGFQGNLLPSAATFLGVQKIRQIVQSATILEIFSTPESPERDGLDFIEFWKHSVACGIVMQMISRDNMQSKHFMTGLLHDVGKLVLELKFAPYAKAIHETSVKEKRPRHEIESEWIGITHAEIGQEIAVSWKLPNELAESIAFHHMPSATQRHKLLSALVYQADIFVRTMEIGHSGNYAQPVVVDAFAQKIKLPISPDELFNRKEDILQQVNAIVSPN